MTSTEPEICRIRHLDCRVTDWDWPFARQEAAAIARHWEQVSSRKPELFDGRILLCREPVISGLEGDLTLRAEFFETRYSAFLAWRDMGFPDAQAFNCFAMAALRTSDGAFILGEMADHTASAGWAYFPAGMLDPTDVVAGRVDLAASAVRELAEETGLDASCLEVADDWLVVRLGARIACMKEIASRAGASDLLVELRAWLAVQEKPEFVDLFAISSAEDLDGLTVPQVVSVYVRHVLHGGRSS